MAPNQVALYCTGTGPLLPCPYRGQSVGLERCIDSIRKSQPGCTFPYIWTVYWQTKEWFATTKAEFDVGDEGGCMKGGFKGWWLNGVWVSKHEQPATQEVNKLGEKRLVRTTTDVCLLSHQWMCRHLSCLQTIQDFCYLSTCFATLVLHYVPAHSGWVGGGLCNSIIDPSFRSSNIPCSSASSSPSVSTPPNLKSLVINELFSPSFLLPGKLLCRRRLRRKFVIRGNRTQVNSSTSKALSAAGLGDAHAHPSIR